MRPSIARANEQLDPRYKQPANTSPPQSTTPALHPVRIHQMAPPQRTSDCSSLLIYRPRKDERLSWPSWLTCSGRFTHITGHSSDAGRAQDRETSTAKHRTDLRSTTVPRHQLKHENISFCANVGSISDIIIIKLPGRHKRGRRRRARAS